MLEKNVSDLLQMKLDRQIRVSGSVVKQINATADDDSIMSSLPYKKNIFLLLSPSLLSFYHSSFFLFFFTPEQDFP